MKPYQRMIIIALFFLTCASLPCRASVPLRWTVETSRAQTAVFEQFAGASYDLEATLNAYGKPLQIQGEPRLYWQTNGMDSAYWQAAATFTNNVLKASFTPQMDVGAKVYNCFIGIPGSVYNAAFLLRLRPSPGATPSQIELPVKMLDFNLTVVTNAPYFTKGEADERYPAKANVYTKAETDARIVELSPPTSLEPATNYTDSATNAALDSAKAYADGKFIPATVNGTSYTVNNDIYMNSDIHLPYGCIRGADWYTYRASGGQFLPDYLASTEWHGSDKSLADYGITDAHTKSQADAAYYPKAQGEAWSTYWDGDDVRVTVTNYDSNVNIPSLYLEQRTNGVSQATNAFKVVWAEMAHWNRFLGTNWNWIASWGGFKDWSDGIAGSLAEKADRAWGFYDSHTGEYAPDGFTQISSSNVIVAAGMGYQRTITTSGDSYWVLTANEPFIQPATTNGTFQIKDADGNVQVEIIKGDKRTVGAYCGGVSVSGRVLTANYAVVASEHPTIEVCADLANPSWIAEGESGCPATVAWSGSSGAYVATVTPTSANATRIFVRATYQAGGDTYVNNRCAVGMSQIVLGGTTYNLGTAVISGNTVLTLTPAN